MKLKCNDGIVRRFRPALYLDIYENCEGRCEECGEEFGIHDTKILKPRFKEHVCKKEKSNGSR